MGLVHQEGVIPWKPLNVGQGDKEPAVSRGLRSVCFGKLGLAEDWSGQMTETGTPERKWLSQLQAEPISCRTRSGLWAAGGRSCCTDQTCASNLDAQ